MPLKGLVGDVEDVEIRGFLRRRLVCDVPGPREEQESPSSLVGALRADLRKQQLAAKSAQGPARKRVLDKHYRLLLHLKS